MSARSDDPAPGATGGPRRRPKKRRRRPAGGGGPRGSTHARAERALGELRALAHELARELGGPANGPFPADAVDLPLTLPMNGPLNGVGGADALVDALRARVAQVLRGARAFREGHVYCFFTDSPDSPNTQPPTPTDVFAGYAANGKPEWTSFPNLCIARREPRVDRLYADTPEVIALVQVGDELSDDLLPGFGRGSLAYAVLGQVTCGLVPPDLDLRRRGRDRVALTLQIVETTQGTDRHRLHLNVLGLQTEAIAFAAAEADARSPAEALRRVLRSARQRVDVLGRQLALAHRRGEAIDRDALVRQLLGRLRTDLLRVLKVRTHRTQHADARHQSGERPTSLALFDAHGVADARLLDDPERRTVIVLGPKSRAHVFTYGGRHVTSLFLEPGELERKTERGRWRPLARDAAADFRRALTPAVDADRS